jgi:transposase InsO family protein
MKYLFIDKHRSVHRVERMCRVLDISRSGYYAWKKRGTNGRFEENERLAAAIRQIHEKSRRLYGSPRITAELHARGIRCGKNRVARLMRINGIVAKTKRRFKVTTDSRHRLPVAPNLLERRFYAATPNSVWASDITYIRTREGWLYLAAVLDVFNRQIVGWAMDRHITRGLVIDAVNMAVRQREPAPGLLFHSDRGSQYASYDFTRLLEGHGFIQSMSSTGNCYDNAIVETFFHTLKTELVYFEKYQTRAEARRSIFEYIEVFYNRIRRHSALGYQSPVNYEKMVAAA